MDATNQIGRPPSTVPLAPRQAPRMGLATSLSWGFGAITIGVGQVALAGPALQYYLNQVVGLTPLIVGTGIMLSLVLDGVVDPFIGAWSDTVRSRWGRRHPFMCAGAILTPIFFLCFWDGPRDLRGAALIGYTFALLAASRVAISSYDMTSVALVPELAPDYDQRTRLISYRTLFGLSGAVLMNVLLNAVFLRHDPQHPLGLLNRAGYQAFGVACAVVILVTTLTSCFGTQRFVPRLHKPAKRSMTVAATLRAVGAILSNPSLVVLFLSLLVSGIGAGVGNGLNFYFLTHLWGLAPQKIAVLVPISILFSLLALIAAPYFSRRIGKKRTMIIALSLALFTGIIPMSLKLVGLMPPNSSHWVLIILLVDTAVSSMLGTVGIVLAGSMVADVVEDAAVKTGARSEGLLFATNSLLGKVTHGVGAFLAGIVLTVVRFPTHAVQGTVPFALMRELVLIYLPASVVLSIISIIILTFYRIDKSTHEQNLAHLRRSGLDTALAHAVDPPTP